MEELPLLVRLGPRSEVAGIRLAWFSLAAVVGAVFRPLTLSATVVVVIVGGVIVWSAMSTSPGEGAPAVRPSVAHIAIWSTIVVAFCLWELAAFLLGDNEQHITLTKLMKPMTTAYLGRVLLWLGWISFADWLLRR